MVGPSPCYISDGDYVGGFDRSDIESLLETLESNYLGWSSWIGRGASELVGRRKIQDLLNVGGRIFHQTHWAPLLQIQGSVAEVKLEVVHRDGQTLPMAGRFRRSCCRGSSSRWRAATTSEHPAEASGWGCSSCARSSRPTAAA